MDDWNDARPVLAVARAGSLTTAAKALRIDHSTVFRRLTALETRLGPLFERGPGGTYQPTSAGSIAANAAERVEDAMLGLARDLAGQDMRLTGRLRITCSETLAYRLLTNYLARFRVEHPGIVVELAVDGRRLNLSQREADVALRVTRPREGDLWGRKLADIAWCVLRRGEPSGGGWTAARSRRPARSCNNLVGGGCVRHQCRRLAQRHRAFGLRLLNQ